ncbi:MAG: phospholipase D-like domain-containing protein [Bacteroidales bacterium]
MFQNNVSCDLYVGSGAGKMLRQDLISARHSIKIISPYVSINQIELLVKKMEDKVDVRLITSSDIIAFKNSSDLFRQIIVRSRFTKSAGVRSKKLYLNITCLLALLCSVFVILISFADSDNFFTMLFMGVLLPCFAFSFYRFKTIRTYYYRYSWRFPIKILLSGASNKYVHSKIYIIDDKIAYVGSMNFTERGMRYNHEVRMKTNDEEVVGKLSTEFDSLFTDTTYASIDPCYILKVLKIDPDRGFPK